MVKMRFTDLAVEKLRAPIAGRAEYQDEIIRSLWLRITTNGHKSWAVAYRYNGKQKRYTIGSHSAVPVTDARKIAQETMRLVANGEDPNYLKKEKIEAAKRYTFAAVVDEYIEFYAKPKNRTWKVVAKILHTHAVPIWGEMPVDAIIRRDVIALMDKVVKRGKPSTTRHLFANIRKLFNWAAERNYIETSPCSNMRNPGSFKQRDRVLSDQEIRSIWKESELLGAPYGTLVQFLLLTGQRLGECAKLTWKEIDFEEKLWRLSEGRVKNKKAHEVPLSLAAIDLLKSLPRFAADGSEDELFAFTTTCGRKSFQGFSKCKGALDAKSGVADWRIHDLRRTCATNLAKLGVPISTISQVLNHTDSSVTAIYNRHNYLSEKRDALEAWAEKLKIIVAENGTAQKTS